MITRTRWRSLLAQAERSLSPNAYAVLRLFVDQEPKSFGDLASAMQSVYDLARPNAGIGLVRIGLADLATAGFVQRGEADGLYQLTAEVVVPNRLHEGKRTPGRQSTVDREGKVCLLLAIPAAPESITLKKLSAATGINEKRVQRLARLLGDRVRMFRDGRELRFQQVQRTKGATSEQ